MSPLKFGKGLKDWGLNHLYWNGWRREGWIISKCLLNLCALFHSQCHCHHLRSDLWNPLFWFYQETANWDRSAEDGVPSLKTFIIDFLKKQTNKRKALRSTWPFTYSIYRQKCKLNEGGQFCLFSSWLYLCHLKLCLAQWTNNMYFLYELLKESNDWVQ